MTAGRPFSRPCRTAAHVVLLAVVAVVLLWVASPAAHGAPGGLSRPSTHPHATCDETTLSGLSDNFLPTTVHRDSITGPVVGTLAPGAVLHLPPITETTTYHMRLDPGGPRDYTLTVEAPSGCSSTTTAPPTTAPAPAPPATAPPTTVGAPGPQPPVSTTPGAGSPPRRTQALLPPTGTPAWVVLLAVLGALVVLCGLVLVAVAAWGWRASRRPPRPFTIEEKAGAVAQLLREADLERAAVRVDNTGWQDTSRVEASRVAVIEEARDARRRGAFRSAGLVQGWPSTHDPGPLQ